jgi:hypothetical protein
VAAFVDGAVMFIAHNSGFDRKFAERYCPVLEHKAWGCSMREIDWRKHGFAGAQLGYLLNGGAMSTMRTAPSTTVTRCWRSWTSTYRRPARRRSTWAVVK